MYDTPLYQAVEDYVTRQMARFHTPGHKGVLPDPLAQAAPYDITEIRGADSLFEADGPIARTEERYTRLYHTQATLLSAGGSTLCIQTMLALIQPLGKKVLLGRNVHASAVSAMALLGLEPVWLYPDCSSGEGLPGTVSPQLVQETLEAQGDIAGVYLTSPDYFGVLGEMEAIAQVCHRHGVPLLVDNAHGAHLAFGEENLHPIHLGADLCCDSLHKTLPVLTGGALLQIGREEFVPAAKEKMALFGSTSPSYLIMLSADLCLSWLEGEGPRELRKTAQVVDWLKRLAQAKGFALPQGKTDPNRLALGFGAIGYTRTAFDSLLTQYGIEPEYLSESYCVLLFSPQNPDEHINRVVQLIDSVRPGQPVVCPSQVPHPVQEVSLRQAMLSPRETVSLEESQGRIAAQLVRRCPPGVPLVVPGERIDREVKNLLQSYGVCQVNVLK